MRLVVYGMVLVLAAIVLALRGGDDRAAAGTAAMYHGQTPEKLLAAAVVRDGRVRGVYMRWRMTCERDRTPEISTIRFGEQFGDEFDYDGRRFSFAGRSDQDVRRGLTTRYDVTLAGSVSADGRTVSGRGRTVETWLRGTRVVDRCHSSDVPFTAHRGAVVSR
jgi:hypothetical protein